MVARTLDDAQPGQGRGAVDLGTGYRERAIDGQFTPLASHHEFDQEASRLVVQLRQAGHQTIAASVASLASPAAGWINGQVLRANGGLV